MPTDKYVATTVALVSKKPTNIVFSITYKKIFEKKRYCGVIKYFELNSNHRRMNIPKISIIQPTSPAFHNFLLSDENYKLRPIGQKLAIKTQHDRSLMFKTTSQFVIRFLKKNQTLILVITKLYNTYKYTSYKHSS